LHLISEVSSNILLPSGFDLRSLFKVDFAEALIHETIILINPLCADFY